MSTRIIAQKLSPKGGSQALRRASKIAISSRTFKSSVSPPSVVQATNVGAGKLFERESRILSNLASAGAVYDSNNDNLTVVSTDEPGYEDILVDLEALRGLASLTPTPLRLADMYKYATHGDAAQRLRNAQFLHKELPIRVAQRAVDLLTLPYGLSESAEIGRVAHIYLRYLAKFQELSTLTTGEEERRFTDMLQSLVMDRTSVPISIAQGINTWRDERREDLDPMHLQEMEDGLYRFFTARVGLRFLIEHHVLSSPHHTLTSQLRDEKFCPNDFLGCIQTNCDPVTEVARVAAEVTRQTRAHYGMCPEIEIRNCSQSEGSLFTYVPHHLQYMVAEMLKNSCRATVQRYLDREVNGNDGGELHPIRVVVVHGAEDVSIKIADRGGGVPRSTMKQIWKFSHSTADTEENETDFGTDEITGSIIRGFGLPLARIYARYFGGELTLKSMEGYGLDAYLYLPRLGEACENLPTSVTLSPGERDSLPLGRRNFSTQRRPPPSRPMPPTSTREDIVEQETRRIINLLSQRAL